MSVYFQKAGSTTLHNIGNGGGSQGLNGSDALMPYDRVIRTPDDFNALIDPLNTTWFDAVSVAFVGQFTLSTANNSGVKIPSTVKQIHGYNGAKITITNFKYNSTTALGGLWYAINPTTNDYEISGLSVDCAGTGTCIYGFYYCTNLSNCTGTGIYGYGFFNCTNLSNCTGTGTSTSVSGYGFSNCTNLSNCTGTGTGAGAGGYGFYNCSHASNCRQGTTPSTTAIWGGITLKIDYDSCDENA